MPGPKKCEVGCTCVHHPGGKLGPAERRERDRERDRNRVRPYDPEKHRRDRLRGIHGISPEIFAGMWDAQGGRCCYCERPLPENPKLVHIDHDHSCTCGPKRSCRQCQRGLSCQGCNHVVGAGGEDPERLERIAANLRRLKAVARERINAKPVQAELISLDLLRSAAGGDAP
jgi:hypothetical protein